MDTYKPFSSRKPLRQNTIEIGRKAVRVSKSSRRLSRLLFKQYVILTKIKKLAEKRRARMQSQLIRQHITTVRAAKRRPRLRVRSRDSWGAVYYPQFISYQRNAARQVTKTTLGTSYAGYIGEKKSIQDYSPVAFLNPPMNPTTIKCTRRSFFKASLFCDPPEYYYSAGLQPMGEWPIDGLSCIPSELNLDAAVGFDLAEANKALLKCYAKVNSADIRMNEYVFEWKQTLSLLKDPLKTLLKLRKRLDFWTSRDAWIWLPNRSLRRFGKGVLVSKQPTGGVLMSMRTRKVLKVDEVADNVLTAAVNRWLQYRYGIMPLALDITTIVSWFQGNLERPWKRSESARHNVKRSAISMTSALHTQQWQRWFNVSRTSGEHYSAKVFYRVKYEPPLSYKLGIHPSQFVQALYNAIPYSFVADWVVNLDDWLSATRNPPWIEYGPNVVTKKVWETIQSRLSSVKSAWAPWAPVVVTGDPFAQQRKYAIRRELNLPKPTLPVWSGSWHSVKNAVTALALIYKPLFRR